MISDYVYSSIFYNPVKNLVAEIDVLKSDSGYVLKSRMIENAGFSTFYETYSFSKNMELSTEQLRKHINKLKEDGFVEL